MTRRIAGFAAAAIAAAMLLGGSAAHAGRAPAPGRSTAGCPTATRCGLYSLNPQRWAAAKGIVTVPYKVSMVQPWLLPEQVLEAIKAAARTWESANPNVRFRFDGISYDIPQLGNNINEIAWVGTLEPDVIVQTNHRAKGTRRLEADTLLNVAKPWGWQPCDGRGASCSDASGMGVRMLDLQAVVTQQMGHWLSLQALTSPAARQLSMYGEIGYGERHKSTLGLGDVMGVRAAYPCGRCRMPRVMTP